MHHYTARILKTLSFAIGVSFLASALALGGLLGDVLDGSEELLDLNSEKVQVEESEDLSEDETEVQVDDDLLELDGDDKYVRIENELLEDTAEAVGGKELGSALYSAQEDTVHGNVTKLTGEKIDHYYAWVCLGDVCIPVDPFTFSN